MKLVVGHGAFLQIVAPTIKIRCSWLHSVNGQRAGLRSKAANFARSSARAGGAGGSKCGRFRNV
jgi:hypothetical protein